MNNCLLCLNLTFQKNAIKVSEKQECGITIEDLIKQHFWFSNEILESCEPEKLEVICRTCNKKLEDFHEFFCAVKFNFHISDEPVVEALDEVCIKSDFIKCESSEFTHMEVEEDVHILELAVEVDDARPVRSTRIKLEAKEPPKVVQKLKARKVNVEAPKRSKVSVLTEEATEVMKQHAEMRCEICSEDLLSWDHASSHYRKEHRKNGFIRCCGRKIDRKCEMVDHVAWHEDPTVFTCQDCGKAMLSRENLAIHAATHIPDELRQFSCPSCPKKFGSSFSLCLHRRLHKKDKLEATIPCPQCPDRKYKTEAQLKLHMDHCHINPASFMCHICSNVYKSKYTLEAHVKTHVDPDKPIECGLCGHFLKNKRRFTVHMMKHKQEDDGPYPCPQCDKQFKHKPALQAHIAYVHTTKRFSCEHCGKVFKHEPNLVEHRAQHTGIDIYSCPFCTRTFKSNANMHSHKKKMHPEEYAQLPAPNYLIPPAEKSANDE